MAELEHVRLELQQLNSESGTDGLAAEKRKRRKFEENLRVTLMKGEFHDISNEVTPRTLTMCDTNALLMAMEVNYSLRRLTENKSPEKDDFSKLSNSVDAFMSCLLDPLKSNRDCRNLLRGCLDEVVDTAIELEQKKILSHPVISNLLKAKWCGTFGKMKRFSWLEVQRWKWLFLNIWCLFDLVLFPVLFLVVFILRVVKRDSTSKDRGKKDLFDCYLEYFTTPYFVFNRDTLSYLTLLGFHVAICLKPSSVKFSCLEWSILVFFVGRTLMESKQFCDTKVRLQRSAGQNANSLRGSQFASVSDNEESELIEYGHFSASTGHRRSCCCKTGTLVVLKKFEKYLSDRWNALDFITLVIYASTFILRVFAWISSQTVINNRALIISGYLYGLNTMFLTLRAFGHVMEATKGLGTVQIALFRIMKDVIAILWQFLATILAFSIALTKVYMAESSFVAKETRGRNSSCSRSALMCWWAMVRHLCWSLLGIPDLSPFDSADHPSVTLARFMYGAFMIMGVILLVNMMIALLSNTYQQVEENSLKEWSFKKAVTIQTYSAYHPVHVPFNLMSNLVMLLWYCWRKCKRMCGEQKSSGGFEVTKNCDLDRIVKELQVEYFAVHGYRFPITDERKLDQLVFETEKNRQLANRIAQCTFASHGTTHDCLPIGSKAWSSIGIKVEGCLLVYEGPDYCNICKTAPSSERCSHHGARYNSPFSSTFPHFEVLIQEIGKLRFLNVGVVRKHHNLHCTPGRNSGSVAFYADGFKGITNAGSVLKNKKFEANVACRGDLIACTVMFEMAANGKVPIVFTVNEQRITDQEIMMDYNQTDQMLYPFVGMGEEGIRVLARMSASKNACYEELRHTTDGSRQCEEVTVDLRNGVQQRGVETGAIETVYRDLDQVSLEFRRLREEMFRSFTNFEDLFTDWYKECLKVGRLAPRQSQIEHEDKKQQLANTNPLQKMKETLQELEELTRNKCDGLFEKFTKITADSKQHVLNGDTPREMGCEN